MYQYLPTENHLFTEELGHYTSFGIDVTDKDGETILSVPDVSPNQCTVTHLCFLCTKLKLDPIHLFDVLEDNL